MGYLGLLLRIFSAHIFLKDALSLLFESVQLEDNWHDIQFVMLNQQLDSIQTIHNFDIEGVTDYHEIDFPLSDTVICK